MNRVSARCHVPTRTQVFERTVPKERDHQSINRVANILAESHLLKRSDDTNQGRECSES